MVFKSLGGCKNCGRNTILSDGGLCLLCYDKEADRLYREDIPVPVIEPLKRKPTDSLDFTSQIGAVTVGRHSKRKRPKPKLQGKPGAWVDKSVPTPDGIVMVDSRGVKYRVRSGRKQTGEWRNCIDCGKPIFVKSFRNGPNQGKRCAPCNRKVYLPPVRVKGR